MQNNLTAKNLRTAWSEKVINIIGDLKKALDLYHYWVVVYTHRQHTFMFRQLAKVNLASDEPFKWKHLSNLHKALTMEVNGDNFFQECISRNVKLTVLQKHYISFSVKTCVFDLYSGYYHLLGCMHGFPLSCQRCSKTAYHFKEMRLVSHVSH